MDPELNEDVDVDQDDDNTESAEAKAAREAEAAKAAAEAAAKGKPSDEEARLLKENMQRKKKVKELADEVAALKGVTAAIDELGGLDAIKELMASKRDAETKSLEAKGDWERLKATMATEHAKEKTELAAKVSQTEEKAAKLAKKVEEITIGAQFAGSEFIRAELLLTPSKARALYGSHFEFEEDGIVGYDKPRGASDRTPIVGGDGEPLSFDKAMAMIIEADPEKDQLKKAKGKSGAGSDTRRANATTKVDTSEMSGVERIAHALANRKK